jgi:palmitoyl-protein thioesterase
MELRVSPSPKIPTSDRYSNQFPTNHRPISIVMFFILLLVVSSVVCAHQSSDTVEDFVNRILKSAESEPEAFAEELRTSGLAAIISLSFPEEKTSSSRDDTVLPLVFLHGMGDSCFNGGMKSITKESGVYMGVYSTCIPTGDNRLSDTINGFLMSMDENVDVFAEKVKADPKLSKGFNCIGLSQGNNICRGYIQRYNDPPVSTHLSIHGPITGVASLPSCDPSSAQAGGLCKDLADVLGKFAYNQKIQDLLFQADYFRDVNYVNSSQYQQYSQMAAWNNEGLSVDATIKDNFAKTQKFAMIRAMGDTVVYPNIGEWWGAYDEDFTTILTMTETSWYKEDLFGLKTADLAGKILFNSTVGNHLDFTTEELYGWLDLYL